MEIQQRFKDSIDRYAEHKIPTGDFLKAVLENNLFEAMGRADTGAKANLEAIMTYIYNEIPYEAWGNPQKVRDWLQKEAENVPV